LPRRQPGPGLAGIAGIDAPDDRLGQRSVCTMALHRALGWQSLAGLDTAGVQQPGRSSPGGLGGQRRLIGGWLSGHSPV